MNYEWIGKTIQKNPIQKNEKKNSKNQSAIAACEQKPLARKQIFVQTLFSHSTLKDEPKKIHAAKPVDFLLQFLFRRDHNHYSNLTSIIMKMCEQIFKKNIAGRIPETTRIGNPLECHPTTNQKKKTCLH